MAYSESTFEWIEAYLTNELSPEERAVFEEKIRTDPEFAEEVALQRDTHSLVEVAATLDYKAELQRIDAEMESMQRQPFFRLMTVRIAAMLLVLFACVYTIVFFQYNNQQLFGEAFSPYPDKYMYRGEMPAADSLMKSGMEAYNQGEYSRAIPYFSQLVQTSEQPGASLYLGISFLSVDNPKAALPAFDLASLSATWTETANWYRALALIQDGQDKAAKAVLEDIRQQETNGYREQATELLVKLNSSWRKLPGM